MLAAAPVDAVVVGPVVAAVEATLFVAADQAVAGHTPDDAQAVKLAVVAVVTEFAVAEAVVAVVVVVSWSAHKDPLFVAVCKSEAAPLSVVMTYLFV